MASHDPQTRHIVSRIGAEISWANTEERAARTKPARDGLRAKFLAESGGDPIRAEHLWNAHFLKLAHKSREARRKAKELTTEAEAAEAELKDAG